jgi:hypothetical protein|nr:MAG TPA: hypothetical protein [Caudoviricetes sp.]
MLDVSVAYMAAIKDKNRTERITGTIKLCDGETINITDDIIVNNSVTLKEQLVSGDTFEIGTFYTNQLDITVYDNNFLSRTYANARITPKYEIQLAGGTWESVPLGVFTVDNSLTKRKGSIHKLTAFDDSTKFDVDISAYSGGKKTVQQHIKDLAADVGITLATTDFSSYPNYNLIVDSTVSSSVQTYRDLIEWCCALMAASARINRYGKLEIVKLKEKKKTVDGVLVYDADYTVEGYERTGTEFFDLRALTKYFSTTFDGEQYVYANSSALEDTIARKATLFLPENPLLRSVSDAERKTAFEACADTIYIALRRVEFSFNGNPAIECFDTLCGNGGKIDVNRTIAFFPTSLVWKYRGAHKVSCAFAELTDEATASASEAAILVATEASTINKMPVQVKSKMEKRLDGVGKTASDAGGVGKFADTDKTSEIFNDYSGNTASGNYSHVEGYKNNLKSEGATHSWATHIEGAQNTEASRTSCPSDKKASYNHIEGRQNNCWGRLNHVEGVNCFAEYDTQMCHVEGNNSHVSEGARVAHVEGKDCVAGNECSHAEGKSAQATGYASHAEGGSCTASGNYSHAGGLSSEASGKCSYAGGELCTASGNHSHAEGWLSIASGECSYAMGKDNTASGDYSIVSGAGSKATGGYAIAHGYKCVAKSDSMAIGSQSQAVNNSYAFGTGLKAYLQTVAFGMYNKETNARFVIGGGTADNPFDALWVDREYNLHVAGKVIADGGVGYVLPTATADTLGGVKIGDNISVTADGAISVNLSAYLKNTDIADWAKAESKPVYTASEVGLGNVDNTADIDKPVSTATQMALDSKDYLKATEITGQTIDLNDITLNTASDKGKSQRYFCTSASAQNISNRPVSANEPFELTVDNIRYVNADAFNSVQRYTSVTRKRSYTRWCDDNIWRAWMCDTDIVIYGAVTSELPKSFDYATYGEGYNQVEIEPYYDNNASPIRNRIVLTLTSATFYDRDVLTVGDSVEHLKIENGTVMMSLTGTKTLSFMIKYTNKRA